MPELSAFAIEALEQLLSHINAPDLGADFFASAGAESAVSADATFTHDFGGPSLGGGPS